MGGQESGGEALERLLAAHSPFRTLVEDVQDFITVVDRDATIHYINHPVAGLEMSEVIGKPATHFVDPEHHQVMRAALAHVVSTGDATTYESCAAGPDGTKAWYENRLSPLMDDGAVVGIVIVATDRTTEHTASLALEHERRFLRQNLDVIDAIVVALDTEGRVTLLNRAGGDLLGVEPDRAVDTEWFDYLPESDKEGTKAVFDEMMAGHAEPVEFHTNDVIDSNGESRTIEWHNALLRDDDGNVTGTLSYGQDVTMRKETAAALAERESLLESVFRASPTGIGITRDRVLLEVNERLCEMVGYSADELVGQSARMLYPSQEEFEWVGRVKYGQIREHGVGTVETRFVRKDGTPIDVLLSSAPMDTELGGAGRVTFAALDITDRMRATRKLLEERAFTETLVDAMQDTFWVRELETGKPLRWNKVFEEVSGYCTEEIARMKAPDDLYDESDVERIAAGMTEFYETGSMTVEAELMTKTGGRVPFEYRAVMINDAAGHPYALCALGRDITDRRLVEQGLRDSEVRLEREVAARTAELSESNKQLRAANQAKSEFLAAMSHELRTPLNSIIGFTGIMADGMAGPVSDEQHRQLEMVRSSGRHLLELVNDILDLARIEAGRSTVQPVDTSVAAVVEGAVDLVRPGAEERGLRLTVSATEAPMRTDVRALQQILLNLLGNAAKFTPEGEILVDARVDEDGFAVFTVADTGPGIDAVRIESIFDAFQQLGKPVGEGPRGTGLGLAISWRLANRLGGRLDVESEPGEGSTFTLTVPAFLSAVEEPRDSDPEEL